MLFVICIVVNLKKFLNTGENKCNLINHRKKIQKESGNSKPNT